MSPAARVHRALPAALVAVVLAIVPGTAQQAASTGEALTVHPEAREAIDKLWSPYCPGLMLEVCPSPGAAALRDSLQQRAARGIEADSLVDGVLAEYGERWRAEPEAEGVGLWAWLAPPLALAAGLGLVAWTLARRASTRPEPDGRALEPEEEARLRAALDELDADEEPAF